MGRAGREMFVMLLMDAIRMLKAAHMGQIDSKGQSDWPEFVEAVGVAEDLSASDTTDDFGLLLNVAVREALTCDGPETLQMVCNFIIPLIPLQTSCTLLIFQKDLAGPCGLIMPKWDTGCLAPLLEKVEKELQKRRDAGNGK